MMDALLKAQSADPAVATPAGNQSLMEMFREVEAEVAAAEPAAEAANETETPADDAPQAAPERGEDGKFKKAAPKDEPADDEPEKKKGVEGKPTVKERISLRQERRELQAKIAAREAEVLAKEQHLQSLIDELESGAQKNVKALAESGDMDAVAKALGFSDWNDMNSQYARRLASPEYRHTKAIEAKLAKLESEQAAKREAEQRQREQAAQQAQITEALQELDGALKAHSDPVVRGLAEDPDFGVAVYNHMDHLYRTTGEMPDIDEAAQTIVDGARKKHSRFTAVFGGQPTTQAEARSRVSPDRAGSKQQPERKANKHVSTNTATEAAEPLPENMTDAQWKKWALDYVRQHDA